MPTYIFKIIFLLVRIIRRIYLVVGILFLLPVLIFIRIFIRYKIGVIHADRLGHLALNTDLFFRRKKLGIIPANVRYYLFSPRLSSADVANSYLLSMYIRRAKTSHNIRIIPCSILFFLLKYHEKILDKIGLLYKLQMNSNEEEFSFNITTIDFTENEKNYGYQLLKKTGINKNKKVVCIFARDNAYLKEKDKTANWNYHDYRNMDVDTYIKGIKYLVFKGYTVVRIGSVVNKPVSYRNKNFIDYPMSGARSDFLDLFLISISYFVIGSSSGATDVAVIFNKPFLGVNYAPFLFAPLGRNNFFIQKKIINSKECNRIIPFKDVVVIDPEKIFDGEYLKRRYGISYVDNTPEEILDAVIEMEQRITGDFVESNNDIDLMKEYFRKYWVKNQFTNVKARLCLKWLRDNESLYL